MKKTRPDANVRLAGGPAVSPEFLSWFLDSIASVMKKERLREFSIGAALERFAMADFDFSLEGIANYSKFVKHRKKAQALNGN